jgi:hypothetical protein
MIRIILLCLLLLVTLPTWSPAAARGPARVRFAEGDVLFRAPDADEWLSATVNTPLDEGDVFWCPEGSRAEIQLPDGSLVRLDGGSQLFVLANEDGFTHLHLASGHLYLRTVQAAGENSLQIDADDTTVLPSARTRLRIDMQPNSLEDVAILKGSAYVEGNGNRTRVRAGEHIMLEDGHSEILPLNPADSWEFWNEERDRDLSRSARMDSSLPEELRGYASELDTNGTWVNVPEYGRVWRPTVIISDDWAPYRNGRWIWKGNDYVWLPYESWGWVPYHYGRWAVVGGFGWCWVPPSRGDVYWGPGYVGWYRTGSHVGWTPLAPGEVFYGHGDYGRHSVNITNVTINTNTVVYRNRTRTGGLTVLQHNDFLRGRTAINQPFINPSASISVSVGSPRIQPLRETRMPAVKQTPPRVAPPRIDTRDTHEMRNRFPRVTPEPAATRRDQQKAPVAAVPAAPATRTPHIREKQAVYPVVVPADRPVRPDSQPQPPARQQREDRRQSTLPPQTAPQPAPPVTQSLPPSSGGDPQRAGQQPRSASIPIDRANHPVTVPSRGESRQGTTSATASPQPQTAAPKGVEQQREPAKRERPQKKVWKVTTPESSNDKDSREKDSRDNDSRGKERKEK